MGWRPRLNVVCGRCGKPTGLRHVCVSNSRRAQTMKPKPTFGKCPKCRKQYGPGGALTHDCAPRSDFKKRKKEHEAEQARLERERKRKARPKHDYLECSDDECKRVTCVAFKTGRTLGDAEGHARGWDQGYNRGFPEGRDSCPREHA